MTEFKGGVGKEEPTEATENEHQKRESIAGKCHGS